MVPCNKSICEISLLLNIPWSTVSGIITKGKQLSHEVPPLESRAGDTCSLE
ncbi:unnamed protein product [Staurois parvus]|uniref:Uncharacterized protein n=1 Tax=Staurois parvus TaxID=386267 RepID=A0ABN9EFZ7_9NEOB|nr:unnamed protein product [Staurois parvus]